MPVFMEHFEHTLLQKYKKPVPEIYKRYIDDGIDATSIRASRDWKQATFRPDHRLPKQGK